MQPKGFYLMNVRNLCLAILHDGETTGYQIRKMSTEGEYAYFVDASYGSIYPALARLETEALVTSRVEQQEGRPAKKVYSITKSGREVFHQSLFADLDDDVYRSEFLLFARFAPQLPASLVEQRINQQLTRLDAEIQQLERAQAERRDSGDQWVIDYGLTCLSLTRQQLKSKMKGLVAMAIPDSKNTQAAE